MKYASAQSKVLERERLNNARGMAYLEATAAHVIPGLSASIVLEIHLIAAAGEQPAAVVIG